MVLFERYFAVYMSTHATAYQVSKMPTMERHNTDTVFAVFHEITGLVHLFEDTCGTGSDDMRCAIRSVNSGKILIVNSTC